MTQPLAARQSHWNMTQPLAARQSQWVLTQKVAARQSKTHKVLTHPLSTASSEGAWPTWFGAPGEPVAGHQLGPGLVPGMALPRHQPERSCTWVTVMHHNTTSPDLIPFLHCNMAKSPFG